MKKKVNGVVHISNHSGKMEGIRSISTSVLKNEFCQKRQKCDNSICGKCYAKNLVSYRKTLQNALERNYDVLTRSVLKMEDLPVLNDVYFRLESFGDLANDIQLINYIRICKKNPNTTFALWTKNFGIVKAVLKFMEKPENLILVASSYEINREQSEIDFGIFDKLFTVYDRRYAAEHNVKINCGARSCLGCRLCYTHNNTRIINEILK